jgi:hypothetical protein
METRKLELKDICGYLPHDLCAEIELIDEMKVYLINMLTTGISIGLIPIERKMIGFAKRDICDITPILLPVSDLYKTITHNGKEIVPIVELAKIAYPNVNWYLVKGGAECDTGYDFIKFSFVRNSFSKSNGGAANQDQVQLFDYLHELKIDYRGLIDADLAIDVNTLENNPYK